MPESSDILISIEERHVRNLLAGTKRIELRRRAVRVPPKTRVWIYSKVPVGQLRAYGIVEAVVEASPSEIWGRYGSVSGLTFEEFYSYFEGSNSACALIFSQVNEVPPNLNLHALRAELQGFHPPQFFKYLSQDSKELQLFRKQVFSPI